MQRKTEILIAVAVLVLLVLFLAFFIFRNRPVNQAPVVEAVPVSDDRLFVPEVAPEDIPKSTVVSASTIAKIFVERFGSYSSESDFANVDDVASLATARFRSELASIAAEARRDAERDAAYYGISTKVLSLKAQTEDDTAVTLLALTQREEAVGSPANAAVRYQDITLSLIKEGEDWKVDGFTWGK